MAEIGEGEKKDGAPAAESSTSPSTSTIRKHPEVRVDSSEPESATVRGAASVYYSYLVTVLGILALLGANTFGPLSWGAALLVVVGFVMLLQGMITIYRDRYTVGFSHARKAGMGGLLFFLGLVVGTMLYLAGTVMMVTTTVRADPAGFSYSALLPGFYVAAAGTIAGAALQGIGVYLMFESLQSRFGVWLLRVATVAQIVAAAIVAMQSAALFIGAIPEMDIRFAAGLTVAAPTVPILGGVPTLVSMALMVLALMFGAMNASAAVRAADSAAHVGSREDKGSAKPFRPAPKSPELPSAPRPASSESMLTVKGLRVQFFTYDGVVQALDGVDFEIKEGETFGLVGETGCGKSVTARAVLRLIPDPPGRITKGEAWFRGDNLLDGIGQEARITVKKHGADIKRNKSMIRRNEDWMRGIRGREISMIFQEPMAALNPIITVGEQVSETIVLHQLSELVDEVGRAASPDGVAEGILRLVEASGKVDDVAFETLQSGGAVVLRPKGGWPRGAAETSRDVGRLLHDSSPYSYGASRALGAGADGEDIVIPLRHVPWHLPWIGTRLRRAEEARLALREARRKLRLLERDTRGAILEKSKETDEASLGRTKQVIAAATAVGISTKEMEESSHAVHRAERTYFNALLRLPFLSRSRHEVRLMSFPFRLIFWFARKSRYALGGSYGERALMAPVTIAAYGRALEMLKIVKIPHPERVLKMYPFELSGGMQQRVMIAIALSCNPSLLIADEPTTALDVTIQAQILELMKELKRKVGSAILLITHDLGVVAETCARVGVMYAGNIVEVAKTEEIFLDPKHPYTQGLIASIPKMDGDRGDLPIIEGSVPNLIKPPTGCRFHPRCPFAMKVCNERKPELKKIGEGHEVACYLYEEGLSKEEKEPLPGKIQLHAKRERSPEVSAASTDKELHSSLVA